jgi:hypothetical protein
MPKRSSQLARALMAAVASLACLGSVTVAAAQVATRSLYYVHCGLAGQHTCELRTMSESLSGSEPVSALAAWSPECGPDAGYPSTTVSEDGSTAVTLEDISAVPGGFDDTPICRLVVTNLASGERRVLPAYAPVLLSSIKAHGWTISPNGQAIAIAGAAGVYIQNVQSGGPPQLLRTGFTPQSVGWYPDGTRLLIAGPSAPLGGRGPLNTANRLFEFTLAGRQLENWLIQSPAIYHFDAGFIDISSTSQVYVAGGTGLLPGATPNMPSGYYLLRLRQHVSTQLIARVSKTHYGGEVSAFGVDSESGLIFITNEQNQVCSVSISSGTRHCVDDGGDGVQVTLSQPDRSMTRSDAHGRTL